VNAPALLTLATVQRGPGLLSDTAYIADSPRNTKWSVVFCFGTVPSATHLLMAYTEPPPDMVGTGLSICRVSSALRPLLHFRRLLASISSWSGCVWRTLQPVSSRST
jgi:hypothetical protein